MSLTINIFYTGSNGSARAFAEEMVSSGIVSDEQDAGEDRKYIKE